MASANQALGRYPVIFLDCRDLRHAWKKVGRPARVNGQVRRKLQCTRCDTTRIDTWSKDGRKRVGASYQYPTGYRLHVGRIATTAVRGEVLRRVKSFGSEDELYE